ncbi:autotransporter assembly complex protein TamA [Yoonia sp. MH D7]
MRNSMSLLAMLIALPTAGLTQDVTLDVIGEDEAITDALRSASLSLSLLPEDEPDTQDYVAAARADYRRLITALYAQGHYSGTVSILVDGREASQIAPLDAPASINSVAMRVDPGPAFTFGRAELAPVPPTAELEERFATGQPAKSQVITQAVSRAVDAWRETGHAKATAGDQQITAVHPERRLDVAVAIAPGPRLTFGTLTISGEVDVREARIRKIAGLPEGEVYDPQALEDAERRLRATGAFDSVAAVESDTIGPNDTLPIELQVVESKPRRFGFGLELSSIEGLKVSSYWMHRNFMSGAERFRVDSEISGIGGETGGVDYRLGARFERPAVYGALTDFFASAELSRQDEPDYLQDKVAFEVGLTRPIGRDLTATQGIGILAAREKTPLGSREYTLFTLPFSTTLERRDEPTDAKSGYYINAQLTPYIDIETGDYGGRVYADARAYRSFGEDDKITIAARGRLGTVLGGDLDLTPADYLFYSGGGGSVRGQAYNSLGITRTVGGVTVETGGLSYAGAQLEARYAVTDKIGVVGFYDFGQIGADAGFAGSAQWHAGAGIGARYNTGIGPIRLDIGTPASGDDIAEKVEVYVGIGQSF